MARRMPGSIRTFLTAAPREGLPHPCPVHVDTLHLDLCDFDGALRMAEEVTELGHRIGMRTAPVSAAFDAASVDLRRGDCGRGIDLLPSIRREYAEYLARHGTALQAGSGAFEWHNGALAEADSGYCIPVRTSAALQDKT